MPVTSSDDRDNLLSVPWIDIVRFVPQLSHDLRNHLNAADRKSTRLNSSHSQISYAVFCLKKKKQSHLILLARRPAAAGADSFPCRRSVPLATVLGSRSSVASALEPVSSLMLTSP